MKKIIQILLLLSVSINSNISLAQDVITNPYYNYELTKPATLLERVDSNQVNEKVIDRMFYDTSVGIVLMITAREGNYTDIRSYLDCSLSDLEARMKKYEGDTSLRLIECRKPDIYPDQIALLHFETSSLGNGFDRCIIYFVHHKNKEIQFSFVYNKANAATAIPYVSKLMHTLKLE